MSEKTKAAIEARERQTRGEPEPKQTKKQEAAVEQKAAADEASPEEPSA